MCIFEELQNPEAYLEQSCMIQFYAYMFDLSLFLPLETSMRYRAVFVDPFRPSSLAPIREGTTECPRC
jgi:hypothetical protein